MGCVVNEKIQMHVFKNDVLQMVGMCCSVQDVLNCWDVLLDGMRCAVVMCYILRMCRFAGCVLFVGCVRWLGCVQNWDVLDSFL